MRFCLIVFMVGAFLPIRVNGNALLIHITILFLFFSFFSELSVNPYFKKQIYVHPFFLCSCSNDVKTDNTFYSVCSFHYQKSKAEPAARIFFSLLHCSESRKRMEKEKLLLLLTVFL